MLQEFAGGPVEERPSRRGLPADDPDQPPLEEMRQDALRSHPSQLLDLAAGDRLSVRDDDEGLDGGTGHAAPQAKPLEPQQDGRQLRPGDQPDPAGDFHHPDSPSRHVARGLELEHGLAGLVERDLEDLGHALERERGVRGEEERFQGGQ